jgi:hypothetical protein
MAANEIGRVAIVGGGVMGAGIAEVCARADFDVTVIEASDGRAERTSDAIERSLHRAVGAGKLDAEAAEVAKRHVAVSAELADAAGAEAGIEAITLAGDAGHGSGIRHRAAGQTDDRFGGPRRGRRERAARPLPLVGDPDVRVRLRLEGGHRPRDGARLRAPDGSAGARRPGQGFYECR